MAKQAESKKARGPQVIYFTTLSGEKAGLVCSYNAIVMICESLDCGLEDIGKAMAEVNASKLRLIMLSLMEGWRLREKPDREPFTEFDAGEAFDAFGGFQEAGKVLARVMARGEGQRKAVDEAVKKLEAEQEGENPTKPE